MRYIFSMHTLTVGFAFYEALPPNGLEHAVLVSWQIIPQADLYLSPAVLCCWQVPR